MRAPKLPITIRLATTDDLVAINDIYNHYVRHSTATYQEEPEPIEHRRAWLQKHQPPQHPVIVACRAESPGDVVGWGSLSPYHQRSAYRFSVENSVYVRHDLHGRGVGSALLADLIDRARAAGLHTIIAGIDAEQTASIALHEKFRFVRIGRLREVGLKFGRRLDVVYMQLML